MSTGGPWGRPAPSADPDRDGPPSAAVPVWSELVQCVYQPVVDLRDGELRGYEALARGPVSLASPAALFAQAARRSQVPELDRACRAAAVRGAVQAELRAPLWLFVNAEPAAMVGCSAEHYAALQRVAGDLQLVLEVTERALTVDPGGLLTAVAAAREAGWRIALDDVGAERASVALMPFLDPDVIKLDLRLVQQRTTLDGAQIIHAVRAQGERTGAVVLAEGIETPEHAELAQAMGAVLGQGFLLGRPAPLPAGRARPATAGPAPGRLPSAEGAPAVRRTPQAPSAHPTAASPYALVADSPALRRATKPLLVMMARQLERQALGLGPDAVVLATFQHERHFPASTAARYTRLGADLALVAAYGTGLPSSPAPGVRGVPLAPDDALQPEWDVVVVGPHFTGALLAVDVGDTGPDE